MMAMPRRIASRWDVGQQAPRCESHSGRCVLVTHLVGTDGPGFKGSQKPTGVINGHAELDRRFHGNRVTGLASSGAAPAANPLWYYAAFSRGIACPVYL